MSGIGLLNEKPLHASIKQWYSRPGDQFEVALHGCVIDVVRGNLLIEIQTGNFSSIRSKLTRLVQSHRVRLVYPIAREKWIVRAAPGDRRRAIRRKSPKRGRLEDLFQELVSIPRLLSNPNFSLEVLLIREEESRRPVRGRRRRGKGWVVKSRRLLEIVETRLFAANSDWLALLPSGLESFTTKDLAAALNTRRDVAQRIAYCLREAGLIDQIGKRGRAKLYRTASEQPAAPASRDDRRQKQVRPVPARSQ